MRTKKQNVRGGKMLSLLLAAMMVLTMIPLTGFALGGGKDCTHEHGADCSYVEGAACNSDHEEHDAECGYMETVGCDHQHNADCSGLSLGDSGSTATPTDAIIIAVLDELDEYTLYQGYEAGTVTLSDLDLPDTLTGADEDGNSIAIEGVTWESDPDFDPEVEADYPGYIFTPTLPDGYILAEGVAAPVITVFIRPADLGVDAVSTADDLVTYINDLNIGLTAQIVSTYVEVTGTVTGATNTLTLEIEDCTVIWKATYSGSVYPGALVSVVCESGPSSAAFTLDAAGSIINSSTGNALNANNVLLQIDSGTVTCGGNAIVSNDEVIVNDGTVSSTGQYYAIDTTGFLTVHAGNISSLQSAIRAAQITMSGGSVSGGLRGIEITSPGSTSTISGGIITANNPTGSAYAVYGATGTANSTLIISGSASISATSTDLSSVSAIRWAGTGSTLTLGDCSLEAKNTSTPTSAIAVLSNGSIKVNGAASVSAPGGTSIQASVGGIGIESGGNLNNLAGTIPSNTSITIDAGGTLTNSGAVAGNIANEGAIVNSGTISGNISGNGDVTNRTVTAGTQSGTLTAGTVGTVTFALTTTDITNNTYPPTLNGAPTGVTANGDVTISGNTGTLTVETTTATPAGIHPLTVTIDGVTSSSFDLVVTGAGSGDATLSAGTLAGVALTGTFTGGTSIADSGSLTVTIPNADKTNAPLLLTQGDTNSTIKYVIGTQPANDAAYTETWSSGATVTVANGDIIWLLVTSQNSVVKLYYKITVTVPVPGAAVGNVTISGIAETALTSGQTATITLTNETVISGGLYSEGSASWFSGLPAGVTVIASGTGNSSAITLTFGGTPTAASTAQFNITIPASELTGNEALAVTANANAKFDIAPAPDITAPILSAGTVNRTSSIAATIGFTTDEAGTAYYFIQNSGTSAPVKETVKAGNNSLGAVSAGTVSNKSVTLTAGAKDIYVVVEDAAGNISAPLKIEAAAYAAAFTSIIVNGATLSATSNQSGNGDSGSWSWVAATNTLTLTGDYIGNDISIRDGTGTATIVINGTASVNSQIYCSGALVLTGNAGDTLNVTNRPGGAQYAIIAGNGLTIENITVNATQTDYYLICVNIESGDFNMAGGKLNISTTGSSAWGLVTEDGNINISGTAEVKTNPTTTLSAISASGNITIGGAAVVDVQSTGEAAIEATMGITISGGTVTAKGTGNNGAIYSGTVISVTGGALTVGDTGGANGDVCGNLTVSGVATSVTLNGKISNGGNLTVSNGTMVITGTVSGSITHTGGTLNGQPPGSSVTDITASFTDANFLAAIRGELGKGASAPIYDIDVAGVTTLNVHSKNITSLAGLEHFTDLTTLECYSNQLTSLPATLPIGLTALYCHDNQLTSLPAALPNGLIEFECGSNQLTTLPALPSGITKFACNSNQLTSLPTLPSSLEILYCYNNQLTLLPTLPSSLEILYCYNNQLTSLPTLPSSLEILYCYQNRLTWLNVTGLSSLTTLDCSYNYMTVESDVTGFTGIWGGSNFIFNPQHTSGFKAVTGITGVPYSAEVNVPLTLTGTVIPADATNQTIVWNVNSQGSTGAAITGDTFTATSEGIATVRATIANGMSASDDYTQVFYITVTGSPSPSTYAVTVNSGTGGGSYAQGATVTITANPAQAGQRFKEWNISPSVTFTSGNASSQTATFTMPAQAVTATAVYENIPGGTTAVTGVTLNRSTLSLYSNTAPNTATLTATVSPSNATDKTVTWISGNTAVATVDQSGNVAAVGNGTAVITVTTTDGGYVAFCTVTVTTYTSGVNPDPGDTTTTPDAPRSFTATPGDKQVLLSWAAPLSNGGKSIIHYEISVNGGVWTNVGSNLAYTVTGLVNGQSYTFRVRAVNANGGGTAASAVAIPGGKVYGITQQTPSGGADINPNNGKNATFRVPDGNLPDVVALYLDGNSISLDTSSTSRITFNGGKMESGSVVVTLYADYLKTLADGTHRIEVVFTDGVAAMDFTIQRVDGGGSDYPDVPKTGDTSNMPLWWIVLGVSVLGTLCVLVWRKWRQLKGTW